MARGRGRRRREHGREKGRGAEETCKRAERREAGKRARNRRQPRGDEQTARAESGDAYGQRGMGGVGIGGRSLRSFPRGRNRTQTEQATKAVIHFDGRMAAFVPKGARGHYLPERLRKKRGSVSGGKNSRRPFSLPRPSPHQARRGSAPDASL